MTLLDALNEIQQMSNGRFWELQVVFLQDTGPVRVRHHAVIYSVDATLNKAKEGSVRSADSLHALINTMREKHPPRQSIPFDVACDVQATIHNVEEGQPK